MKINDIFTIDNRYLSHRQILANVRQNEINFLQNNLKIIFKIIIILKFNKSEQSKQYIT